MANTVSSPRKSQQASVNPLTKDYSQVKMSDQLSSFRSQVQSARSTKMSLMTLNSPRVEDLDEIVDSEQKKPQFAKLGPLVEPKKKTFEEEHPGLTKWN